MPRSSEEYLDSLLNSVLEQSSGEKKENKKGGKKTASLSYEFSDNDFLKEFEKELGEDFLDQEESDFLKEFEKEIGIAPEYDDELEDTFSSDKLDKGLDDDLDGILSDIVSPTNQEQEDNTEDDASDILNSLTGALNEDVSDYGDLDLDSIISTDDNDNSKIEEASKESTSSEPQTLEPVEEEDEEDDVMSDIDEASGDSENDADAEPVSDSADIEEASKEPSEESAEEGSTDDSVSNEEIMDIGNLLDSIDEDGNIDIEDSKEANLVDEQNSGSSQLDESGESSGGNEAEEKKGFLAKILGALGGIFKKKEKPEGEEEEESEEPAEAETAEEAPSSGDENSKEAKKKAKQEEKERKKKEKAEAKKKAAEEKAKNKKEKPKKEKKPKKPDNSPKIPIKVLIPFVLLSISLIILFNVAKNTIGHEMIVSSAKTSFDKGEYVKAYSTIGGANLDELNEDEAMLYNRIILMSTLELRLSSYELYSGEKDQIKAIDALVRGAEYYSSHKKDATQMGIPSEFDSVGRIIITTLSDVYGVSEDEAVELLAISVRSDYTKELFKILEKQGLWSMEK